MKGQCVHVVGVLDLRFVNNVFFFLLQRLSRHQVEHLPLRNILCEEKYHYLKTSYFTQVSMVKPRL